MNRQQLVTDIFENFSTLRRLMMGQAAAPSARRGAPTHAQLGVMFMLSHRGEMSIKELARRFGMTSSAATQLVTSLVQRGWVKRQTVTGDRRKVSLRLSMAGRRLCKAMMAKRAALLAKHLEILNDQELKQLKAIQDKIIAHHRAYADLA